MEWFSGNVTEAIQRAKANGSIFIVLIEGDDDSSRTTAVTMNDEAIVRMVAENRCVAIKLDVSSQPGRQFSQIYPVMCVPSVYFINGCNGIPLEISGGAVQAADMIEKFNHALELHRSQSIPTAANSGEASNQRNFSNSTSTATSKPNAASNDATSEKPDKSKNISKEPVESSKLENFKEAQEDLSEGAGAACSRADAELNKLGSDAEVDGESSESLEEKRERAEALLAARRAQKEAEEKEKARQEEKERRRLGKEMTEFKNWKSEMERKEIETSLKKEREEAKRAREKVKEEIERDRKERAMKFQTQKESEKTALEIKKESRAAAEAAEMDRRLSERRENSRIQFRLPDGSSVSHTFLSSENLSVARDYIAQRLSITQPITLMCTFPKRTFVDDDMTSTLLDLDLAPSAALIVLLSSSSQGARGNQSSDGFLAYITSALLALWLFFIGLFTTPRVQASDTPSAPAQNRNVRQSSRNIPDSQTRPRQKRGGSDTQQIGGSAGAGGASGVRKRDGNIHRLRLGDDEDDDDDESATWNGNSTQQM